MKNNRHLYNAWQFYEALSHPLFYLILRSNSANYYDPHFTGKEVEAQRGKVIEPEIQRNFSFPMTRWN